MLAFDAASHTYTWDGKLVPNVTRIIAPLTDYSRIPEDVLERARQEGKAIHKMVELACRGTLDVASLETDPAQAWLRPYYRAWLRFLDETGFELWESEQQVYHMKFGYAGTFDLVGCMTKTTRFGLSLLDIKRSFYAGLAIGVQLAGYEQARNARVEKDIRTNRRFGLQLRKDGTYRLQPFEDRDDFAVFLSCLTLHQWRTRHASS